MAGLVGVAGARGPQDTRARFGLATSRMLRHGRLALEDCAALDGACLLGQVRLGRTQPTVPSTGRLKPAPTAEVLDNIVVLLHGVVYNAPDLKAVYRKHGVGFVERLEGEFCLALLDLERRLLLVATDSIGNHPLYWRHDEHGLIFASDLSAVLQAAGLSTLDLQAVADYLTAGIVLGDRTLARGVELVKPGHVLTYDLDAGSVGHHQYDAIERYFEPKARSKAAYIEEVQSEFKRAVDRSLASDGPVGLSLSGGLDSRAILSAINGRASVLRTYTLGIKGCADEMIAQRLATLAGTNHRYFPLDSRYLRDFLPNMARMVSMTDGMYLSHGLTEMLALQFLDDTGISTLLRGHGGELAKAHLAWPLHTDGPVRTLTSISAFVDYISNRANYVTPGLSLSTFLVPEAASAAGEGARTSYRSLLAGTPLSPSECCSYLYLHELHRRLTVPSLELFRTRVDVRLPYLDRQFLKTLLGAPAEWRDTTEIHQALTRVGIPGLLKVRNSNTGAPADAGPALEAILDKWNTVLKRLNVPGYRHYHNFDGWMRAMLLESVQAELLAPGAKVAAFVSKSALQTIVEDTRSGRADRSYLLQVLLILELWQRENGIEAAA